MRASKLFSFTPLRRLRYGVVSATALTLMFGAISTFRGFQEWNEDHREYQAWIANGHEGLCENYRSGVIDPDTALSDFIYEHGRFSPLFNYEAAMCTPEAKVVNSSREQECEVFYGPGGHKKFDLLRDSCGPTSSYPFLSDWTTRIRQNAMQLLLVFLSVVSIAFLLLSAVSLYIEESNLGWKRLVVLASSIAPILAFFGILWWVNDVVLTQAVLVAISVIPLSSLLLLGGKSIFNWVRSGFREGK